MLHRFIPVHTGNSFHFCIIRSILTVYPCAYRELCFYIILFMYYSRFIPVHTGNSHFRPFFNYMCPVYPCAYRELTYTNNALRAITGLSLCIQGTRLVRQHRRTLQRFIPVHTGNSPIITYCFIIKILNGKFLPIFLDIFH